MKEYDKETLREISTSLSMSVVERGEGPSLKEFLFWLDEAGYDIVKQGTYAIVPIKKADDDGR